MIKYYCGTVGRVVDAAVINYPTYIAFSAANSRSNYSKECMCDQK